jgi:ribonuclease-3
MPKNIVPVEPLEQLDNIFAYSFRDRNLLLQALTHQSAINEKHPNASTKNYRSLAFVGDAALKYVVSVELFSRKKVENIEVEGLHNQTVQRIMNHNLAAIARDKLKLERFLVRGNGEETVKPSMYATCLEAILGVITIDCQNNGPTLFKIVTDIFELNK